MNRNKALDIYRLFLCVTILLFHGYKIIEPFCEEVIPFFGGSLAVEGFFIISGYYFTKEVETKENDIKILMLYKIKRVYPIYFFALFIHIIEEIGACIIGGGKYNKFLFIESDILMLGIYEIPSSWIIVPSWFLSAMLSGMCFIYPFIKKYKSSFYAIYSPIIAFALYGFLFYKYGEITPIMFSTDPVIQIGIISITIVMIRAVAGLLLGTFCYAVCEKLKEVKFSNTGRGLATLIAFVSIIISIIQMFHKKMGKSYEICTVFAWFNLAVIILSRIGFITEKINSMKFDSEFIAEYSLAVYLNQYYCLYVVRHFVAETGILSYLLYISSSLLMGGVAMKFAPKIFNALVKILLIDKDT